MLELSKGGESMPTGPNGERRPSDPMALAKKVMDIATGEAEEEYVKQPTPEQTERGKKAAATRWGN